MSRAIYVLIFLVATNLVITIYGFVNQPATQSQVIYVPAADKSTPATAAASTVPTIAVKLPDEKILRDMIQAILKQELEPYRTQSTTSSKVSTPGTPQLNKTSPENAQAYNQAKTIVDNALAQGIWTADLNQQLQSVSAQLTPEQHDEILKQLIIAIDQQQLKITLGLAAMSAGAGTSIGATYAATGGQYCQPVNGLCATFNFVQGSYNLP